jgi:hypothetical protein
MANAPRWPRYGAPLAIIRQLAVQESWLEPFFVGARAPCCREGHSVRRLDDSQELARHGGVGFASSNANREQPVQIIPILPVIAVALAMAMLRIYVA